MSASYTRSASASETFNITHARYIASKVATDLLRFQRFYGSPSDQWINNYEAELVMLLKHDAVESVVYGFKRNGKWTVAAIRYTASPGGKLLADDDPGKIRPGLDIVGASFTSFLTYSGNWYALGQGERDSVEQAAGFQRTTGMAPPLEAGYWSDDLSYTAAGRGLARASVRR